MKKSPLETVGALITTAGIILTVASIFALVDAGQSYQSSCKFYSTWDGKKFEGTAAKMISENPNQDIGAALRAEKELKDAEVSSASSKLEERYEAYTNAKILWGSGCGVGAIMAVVGFVVKKRGKVSSASKKQCPFCSETIKREAVKCKFCGADLAAQPASKPATRPTPPPVTQHKAKPVDPFAMPAAPKFLRQENGAIHFECGYCSQRIEIDAAGGGLEIKCPDCGEKQKVPTS